MTSEIRENEHLDWLPFLVVARGGVRHGYARFVDWPIESVLRPAIAGTWCCRDATQPCDYVTDAPRLLTSRSTRSTPARGRSPGPCNPTTGSNLAERREFDRGKNDRLGRPSPELPGILAHLGAAVPAIVEARFPLIVLQLRVQQPPSQT